MTTAKKTIKSAMNRQQELLKTRSIKQLCEDFAETSNRNDSVIPMVRGWIMDELELRDSNSFDLWMETEDVDKLDHPEMFFIEQGVGELEQIRQETATKYGVPLESITLETAEAIARQQPARNPLTDGEARNEMCRNYGINSYTDALNRFSDPAPHRKRNITYQQLGFRKIALQEKGRELGVVESSEYESIGLTTDEYVEQFATLLLRGASVPEATLLAALV